MVTRGWVGPLVGLIVSLLLYFLLVPILPGGANQIMGIVLIIIAVVCAVLLVVGFIRG